MKQLYFTVYKTTNLINNKIYIGKHVTTDPNDRYLGSGHLFQKALQKYGVKNFKKEVLFIFDNEKEMLDKERELVNEEFIKDDNNYNLIVGGTGNFTREHGNSGTNSKLTELNAKPWIWVCNPSIGVKKRFWNSKLTADEINAGWEYGTLSESNFIQVIYDDELISIKMLAYKFGLNSHLLLLRHKAKWSVEEMLTIPESLQLYKTEQEKTLNQMNTAKCKLEMRNKNIHIANEQQAKRYFEEFSVLGKKRFIAKYDTVQRKKIYKLFRKYINEYKPQCSGNCGRKILIDYNGKTQPLNKWISDLDLSHSTVYLLHDKGIDFIDIFSLLSGHPRCKEHCKNNSEKAQIVVAREYLKAHNLI